MKVKKALELPKSISDRMLINEKNKKKNLPVSSGPSNLAMSIEDIAFTTALIQFATKLIENLLL